MKLKDTALLKTASYVGGEWLDAGGKSFALNNPATGEKLADIADHGASTIRLAIEKAAVAQKEWAARTAKDRAMLMRGWFNLIMENQEDLPKPVVKLPMAPLSSTGLPKKAAAFPVISSSLI
jgi:succinate-semialdehyde dehydrogenase/glutarate-semialdehyde dehydrogenase